MIKRKLNHEEIKTALYDVDACVEEIENSYDRYDMAKPWTTLKARIKEITNHLKSEM